MDIILHQIQSLLNTYQRQQLQSRLAGAKVNTLREGSSNEGPQEDRVVISAEAKRIQLYQRMAEEVLKRMKEEGEGMDDGAGEPSDPSNSQDDHPL